MTTTTTEYAVQIGGGIYHRTKEEAKQWVQSYLDHPDALEPGESMPVVLMRTVTVSEWEQCK